MSNLEGNDVYWQGVDAFKSRMKALIEEIEEKAK